AETAEVAHEDVERVLETEPVEPAMAGVRTGFHSGMTEPVIGGTLFRIAQYLVRLGGFLELLLRLGIARVSVGVVSERQLPVRLLDDLGVGGPFDLEDFVVIPQ